MLVIVNSSIIQTCKFSSSVSIQEMYKVTQVFFKHKMTLNIFVHSKDLYSWKFFLSFCKPFFLTVSICSSFSKIAKSKEYVIVDYRIRKC